jgi:secreted PhoX family phosphatase
LRRASAGVQRIDTQDPNYDTRTVTIVQPGTQGFVSGDASRWTPWGGYLTAEESWAPAA